MEFITNDNVKINYQIQGDGQPIIFVTGFGGYQEVWLEQKNYFAQMDYQIITYDHRNFGRSQRTTNGHKIECLTKDLVALVQHLQIKHAVFVGHSMGGSIIYNLIKIKPELVKLAVIVDQTPFMLNTKDWPYGFMNYTADNYLQEAGQKPKVRETIAGLNNEVAFALSKVKLAYPFSRNENFDLLCDHILADWRSVIKNTPVPISIIAARQSPYYNSDFAKWMGKESKLIEPILVNNCGHDIMAEVPEQFNQILRHLLLRHHYLND